VSSYTDDEVPRKHMPAEDHAYRDERADDITVDEETDVMLPDLLTDRLDDLDATVGFTQDVHVADKANQPVSAQ